MKNIVALSLLSVALVGCQSSTRDAVEQAQDRFAKTLAGKADEQISLARDTLDVNRELLAEFRAMRKQGGSSTGSPQPMQSASTDLVEHVDPPGSGGDGLSGAMQQTLNQAQPGGEGLTSRVNAIEDQAAALEERQQTPAPSSSAGPAYSPVVSIHGVPTDVNSMLATYYKRPWTYPGGIDTHLREHGISASDLALLSHETREHLHAAIHERELLQGNQVANKTSTTVVPATRYRQFYSGGCPGGVCPTGASYSWSGRRGLFGRRRW